MFIFWTLSMKHPIFKGIHFEIEVEEITWECVFHCRPCRQSFAIADQKECIAEEALRYTPVAETNAMHILPATTAKKRSAVCYKRKPATKVIVTSMTEDWANHPGFEWHSSTASDLLQQKTHDFHYNYAKNVTIHRQHSMSISKEISPSTRKQVRNFLQPSTTKQPSQHTKTTK
jgi:hypothetical protein